MSRAYRPVSALALTDVLATRIARTPGLVRVAVDGPPAARPCGLAQATVAALPALGRPAYLVRTAMFRRDASLRFEYGREDPDSYRDWLDEAALRREVLDAAVTGWFLPSLRDPDTNRATRAPVRTLEPDAVLVVCGELLLGRGLPWELTIHLAMSPAARERRTPPELAWTLPAFDRYDTAVGPEAGADVVVRVNDPRHPAVSDAP